MEIKLEDDEIRSILAAGLEKKLNFEVSVDPQECWFECRATEHDGEQCEDIFDVKFCFRTTTQDAQDD